MNSMTIVTVAVLLCLVTLKSACALQCVYFPRTFLSHLEISNATINQQRCSSLENITNSWNDFLGTQINFLLLQQCVVLNGTDLTASSSCITEIKKTFQPLFNSPLCRNTVPPTDSWACIFDPLDPCLKSEQAGPTGNVLSLLCKLKSLGKHWLSGLKGTLKSMGLDQKQLLFYTSGLYANVHGLRGTVHKSTNKDTYNFIGNLLCSKVPDGNCCNGPDGCNLPKHLSQTSFYATVGVREIMNAYTNDVYLRDYLASAAGVHHIRHPADHRGSDSLGRIGSPDRHTDNQGSSLLANKGIVAAMLGALAFACLALLICLIGVCYVQQRKRRCQKSDEPESLLKSESPHAQHQRKQQQQQHHHNHHHDNSGAAEKLLSSSTSSSSAFNICPAPSAAVGIAAIGIGSHSYIDAAIAPANNLHQQQQRMFAVPNRSGASAMAVACGSSSGVGTGDSLPSTSNNDRQQQQQQQQQQQNSSGEGALAFGDSQTGSGSGQPILLPRTVAREIEHRESIGQGRFGQVYRSEWRNDPVAVKIFSSRAESSWSTEGHMYELPGMRHDAILGFIAIDNIDIGLETQLWLITDYHANGSLQSYLTRCSVDQHTMSRMLHSIASGLAHLHSEISGVKCKPAIAHRDIKSNNILVKADLSCCIADFGLAVALQPGFGVVVGFGSGGLVGVGCSDSGIGETNNNNNGRVGTRRYLSPECLNGSQDSRDFTALRKADIYATGLVFWELAVRCHDPIRGVTSEPEYQQPYQDLVPNNPTLEEMQQVVCPPANVRPPLSPAWQNHPVLERLCRVLTECWYQSPAARLEAMSVKDQTARMLHTSNELLAADKEVLGTVVA